MTRRICISVAFALAVASCAPPATPPASSPTASPAAAPVEVTLMTHDSFAISPAVLDALADEHGIRLRVLRAGDAGAMVNQAILARAAPLADVLFGVDNTFLSRALEADIFEAYVPPALADVPGALRLDPQGRVTPVDYGDVCLNYDRAAFDAELPPPSRLEDLVDPRYRGMFVTPNPATSSPGLAFLLATAIHFGEGGGVAGEPYGWQAYWRELVANDVLVTAGWSDAYFGHFSAAGDGDRPIVLSYATSPVAEVVLADPPPQEPPTAVVTEGCFRQVEFAGILAGTPRAEQAQRVIDFMLSHTFQEDVPLNMFVFPAVEGAEVPEEFDRYAARVAQPLTMDPTDIGAQRERLIEEWTDVVLR